MAVEVQKFGTATEAKNFYHQNHQKTEYEYTIHNARNILNTILGVNKTLLINKVKKSDCK